MVKAEVNVSRQTMIWRCTVTASEAMRVKEQINILTYIITTIIQIKCKKLTSLQHRVRATKAHIQNSKNHFTRPS